jgi:hypothetical protein
MARFGLHRAAGLIVLRECRQWQHNVALSDSIPLQPAPFLGKFNLWRIVVAEMYGPPSECKGKVDE